MYYIYHIPNVKIGCSDDAERRVNQQGYTDYEILEEHTCIYTVSKREQQLQKQYGYPVDKIPYYLSVKSWGSVAGKVGGKKAQKTLKEKKVGLYTDNTNLRKKWSKKGNDAIKQKIKEIGKEEYYSNPNIQKSINKWIQSGAAASRKPIIKMDKNGNQLKIYSSITEASKDNNILHASLSSCLNGKTKTSGGYKWIYADKK